MATFITKDRYKIHYEIFKEILPETTLFIHGNLSSNKWWYPSLNIFNNKNISNLSGNMIMVELRGFGQSEVPELEKINIMQFCDDCLSLIKNQGWEKINLVGHSTGGIISALMLAANSELFNKVILLDPVGASGFPLPFTRKQTFKLMEVNKAITSIAIGSVIYGVDYNNDFFKNVIVEDAQKSVKVGLKVFEDLDKFNVVNILQAAKINNKVLVLHGEKDNFLPIEDSKELAKYFINSEFRIIRGHGHSLNIENPKLFVEIIEKFLFST